MKCSIIRNAEGKIENVKANNGNDSLLFEQLKKSYGEEKAIDMWILSKHESIKDKNTLVLDENNEPTKKSLEDTLDKYREEINYKILKASSIEDHLIKYWVPILSKYGFNASSIQDYKASWEARNGKKFNIEGVKALVDFTTKSLVAANTKEFGEEVGHIVIALTNPDDIRLQRALESVSSYPLFGELYVAYKNTYSKSEPHLTEQELDLKVKKEILGKVMGEEIVKNPPSRYTGFLRLLKQLFNKIVGIFSNKNNSSLRNDLNSILSDLAKGSETFKTIYSINEGVFFNQDNSSTPKSTDSNKKILQKIIKAFDKRKRDIIHKRGTDKEKAAMKIQLLLEDLALDLAADDIDRGLIIFTKHAKEGLEKSINKMREVIEEGIDKFDFSKYRGGLSGFLNELEEFRSYYKPFIDSINSIVDSNQAVFERPDIQELFGNDFNTEIKRVIGQFSSFDSLLAKLNARNMEFILSDDWRPEFGDLNEEMSRTMVDEQKMWKWVGTIHTSRSPFLRVIGKWVKNMYNSIFRSTLDFGKDLIAKHEELGNVTVNKLLSKTNGKFNGYFVAPRDYAKFNAARREFFEKINKQFNLSEEIDTRRDELKFWDEEARGGKEQDYKNAIKKFYSEHTETRDDWEVIFNEVQDNYKKGIWSKIKYDTWMDRNFQYGYAKGELVQPKESKYRSKEYDSLSKNEKAFLQHLINTKREIDKYLPGFVNPYLLPQISASSLDILKRGDLKNIFSDLKELTTETFQDRVDDVEFGSQDQTTRPDGTKAEFIPLFYRSLLENPNLISQDILSSMVAYKRMAETFKHNIEELPKIQSVIRQLKNRTYVDPKTGEETLGKDTNTVATAEKFVEMYMFGKQQQETKVGNLNVSKLLRGVNKYIRSTNLIFNPFTQLAGYFSGRAFHRIEKMVARHINEESTLAAEKEFWSNLPKIIRDIGKINQTNKMHLMFEKHQMMDDIHDIFDNVDIGNLTRAAFNSGAYANYKISDYRVKGMSSLAIMFNYRLVDGEFVTKNEFDTLGKSTKFSSYPSYYDLHEAKGYKLVPSKEITEDHINYITNKMEYLNTKIDGTMGKTDRMEIFQNTYGQLATTHRGWLIQGLINRFKAKGINEMTGLMEEGYYKTIWDMLASSVKTRKIQNLFIKENWNKLEDFQKEAVLRIAYDHLVVLGMLLVAKVLNNIADDDDDEYSTQFAAYLANRVFLEVSALSLGTVDPTTGYPAPMLGLLELNGILTNPFVFTKQFDVMLDFKDLISFNTEIERGPYKGMSKTTRALLKLTPGAKGIMTAWSAEGIESINNFIKSKPLKAVY